MIWNACWYVSVQWMGWEARARLQEGTNLLLRLKVEQGFTRKRRQKTLLDEGRGHVCALRWGATGIHKETRRSLTWLGYWKPVREELERGWRGKRRCLYSAGSYIIWEDLLFKSATWGQKKCFQWAIWSDWNLLLHLPNSHQVSTICQTLL